MDYGNTARRPPVCDLRAWRDERHSKHAARWGAVNSVVSQDTERHYCRLPGSKCKRPFNWERNGRWLINFDRQVVENRNDTT